MVDQEDNKLKLLCLSDYAHTGFGRVMREVLGRLTATGLFDVRQVGWCYTGDPDIAEDARERGIKLYPGARGWGHENVQRLLTGDDWQADLILSLGDPWMIDWVGDLQEQLRERHGIEPRPWVAYVPIDRPILSRSWEEGLMAPDLLILYSRWGVKVVEQQLPGRDPLFIPHGVDSKVFKPLTPAAKMGIRSAFTIPAKAFTVGSVCRNQVRKNVPAILGIFKAFNCTCAVDTTRRWGELPRHLRDDGSVRTMDVFEHYSCPACGEFEQDEVKAESRLYLHMTMGESPRDREAGGWSVNELAQRYGLKGRIHGTPSLDVIKGVSDEVLNKVFNAFHAMLLPTTREGFGLPVLEAASAGVPVVATDCSSVSELLEGGCGLPIRVASWHCAPFFEADSASVDMVHGADQLHRLFVDRTLLVETAASARQFARANDWDAFTGDWVEALFGAVGREVPELDEETPEGVAPDLQLVEGD